MNPIDVDHLWIGRRRVNSPALGREFSPEHRVGAGHHGQMSWMADRAEWRGSAAALWPEARSVIMLAEAYTPDGDPMVGLARRDRGVVSVYAQGRDYHDLVKRR